MEINILTNSCFNTTAEGFAAEKLRDMLSASIPDGIEGEIYIASNVKHLYEFLWLIDIDILVWGEFSNYVLPQYYSVEDKGPKKDLVVKDFFIVFDLKSHQADRVSCEGSQVLVKYSDKTQNVSHSIDLQREHLLAALNSERLNVVASDAIWLNSVTKEELSKITSGKNVNALPNEFEFKDIIDIIITQGIKPDYDEANDCFVLSSGVDLSEVYSEMLYLNLADMRDYDGAYDEEDEEDDDVEVQRKDEAEARARDYFYKQKVRGAKYCSDGYLDDFPDYSHSTFIHISDDDLVKIKQLVIEDVKANEGSKESDLTFEEVLKLVTFDKIYNRNEEIRSLLDLNDPVEFLGPDGHVGLTANHIPSVIDFDNPMYSYRFRYVAYNKDNTFVATPEIFDVMLTDEEYITLLTQLLLSYPDDYTFNQLLKSHPDLAAKISRPVMCEMPYIILLDEVKEDALAIVSSSEFKESDSFTAQNVDSIDLPF